MSNLDLLAAVLAVVTPLFAAPAAEVNHSWDKLAGTLKAGTPVAITRTNSAVLEGKLVSIDDQSITLRKGADQNSIARADVLRVRTSAKRRHHVLYGMAIGAAAGAAVLWAADRASDKHRSSEAVGIGIFLGVPAGAVIGAAIPDGVLLYEAERNARNARPPQ